MKSLVDFIKESTQEYLYLAIPKTDDPRADQNKIKSWEKEIEKMDVKRHTFKEFDDTTMYVLNSEEVGKAYNLNPYDIDYWKMPEDNGKSNFGFLVKNLFKNFDPDDEFEHIENSGQIK